MVDLPNYMHLCFYNKTTFIQYSSQRVKHATLDCLVEQKRNPTKGKKIGKAFKKKANFRRKNMQTVKNRIIKNMDDANP